MENKNQPLTEALFYILLAVRRPVHGYGIIFRVGIDLEGAVPGPLAEVHPPPPALEDLHAHLVHEDDVALVVLGQEPLPRQEVDLVDVLPREAPWRIRINR